MKVIFIFSNVARGKKDEQLQWVLKKGKSNLNADTVYLDLEICPTGKLLDNTELYRLYFYNYTN